MIIVKKRPMTDANRKHLQRILGIKPILGDLSAPEHIQMWEQFMAGFEYGLQHPDPELAIRIRTLVEDKINERQPELIESEVEQ